MNIKENMLLADFLGWEKEGFYFNLKTGNLVKKENDNCDLQPAMYYIKNGKPVQSLLFNSDWNWLMLVVEKINTIEGGRFTFQIMSMDVEIHDYLKGGLYIDFFSGNTPDQLIKSVYEACVEFVKKYNNE